MADPTTFEDLRQRLYVRWSLRPRAGAFLRAFSAQRDALNALYRDAAKVNFPGLADDSALDAGAASRNLERIPGESHASLRAYLQTTWDVWRNAGTRARMLAEIARLGCTSCEIWGYRELVQAGFPPAVTFGGFSSFFFILIKVHPFTAAAKWNDGSDWNGGQIWGLGATRQQVDNLRRAAQKWKPGGTSLRFYAIDLAGDAKVDVPKWGMVPWGGFRWGAGLRGSNLVILPQWEDWEVQPNGARREFYNYSPLFERV